MALGIQINPEMIWSVQGNGHRLCTNIMMFYVRELNIRGFGYLRVEFLGTTVCAKQKRCWHTRYVHVANPVRRQLEEMDSGIAREEENKKRKQWDLVVRGGWMTQSWLSRLLTYAPKECLVWEGNCDSCLLRTWHPQKPVRAQSHM